MKEDFLHYLWKFQKIEISHLNTVTGSSIQIISIGTHNTLEAGPDFFNAQLIIDNQKWAGNIEIHVKSSDWYVHQHQNDNRYQNVILHVVWEHDVEVFLNDNTALPTLQLKDFVSETALKKYTQLFENQSQKWINCENQIQEVAPFVLDNWIERLYFERLEIKIVDLEELAVELNYNWEAICFCLLAKTFGSNSNGDYFLKVAKSIPFSVVQKATSSFQLEALFMGQANLLLKLDREDIYYNELQKEYGYLKHKYQLQAIEGLQLQFFKVRPSNFPTIRFAQLAQLYSKNVNIFSKLIQEKELSKLRTLFKVKTSLYWEAHFTFSKKSTSKIKRISNNSVDLLVINMLLPLRFLYAKVHSKDIQEELINLLVAIKPENNSIINGYKKIKVEVNNALHSQALLSLKKEYCNKNECLKCGVGYYLLNQN